MKRFIEWLVKVIIEFFERRRKMDYFITLNEKSIDAIGEAVEKPIMVIDELKETLAETIQEKDAIIAEKDEIIADKDEEIEGLEEQIANAYVKQVINVTWVNNKNVAVDLYDYTIKTTIPDRMDGLGVTPGSINANSSVTNYNNNVFRKTSTNLIELSPALMLSGSRILNTCSVTGTQVDNPEFTARINDQHIVLYNVANNTKAISITVTIPA